MLLASVVTNAPAATDPEPEDLLGKSLEQLMEVEVYAPATITEKDPLKVPASVTIITADDIARTPARNLLDLMEVYVPGFMWMNHSAGPLPGIRGILVDRPYKFLVNVNGINVNIKTYYGARLELLNWDLGDIDHIEVIRGPGSVTYGPGAIGGVINIYTKTAKEAPCLAIGGHFWDKYDSIGNYVSYGHKTDKLDLYTYFSIVHTSGTVPDLFGVDSSAVGYLGHPGAPKYPYPAAEYFKDYHDEPQIKAMLDVHFKDTWRFWARYVTSSHDLIQGNAQQFAIPGPGGEIESFRQTRYRYYQFALENRAALTDNWDLKSTFGLSSIDVHNVEKVSSTLINSRESLQNVMNIFSEGEYYTQFMFNYKPKEGKIKGAVGFEFSYDIVGPAWGKNANDGLRIGNIISGPSSQAYGIRTNQVRDPNFFVGNGWETYCYALLGELNIQLTPKLTTILSGRLDKHKFTNYMLSPRLALIYEIKKDEFLKFIAQRSVRINTQDELLTNERLGVENKPEKLDTFELIYSGNLKKNWSVQTSLFYNKNEAIAWDAGLRQAAPVGTLEAMGIEIETKYHRKGFEIGASHSYVKQLRWRLANGVSTSGISYSDYNSLDSGVTSRGNDLANWADQATKLFTNFDLFDGKVTVHGDAQAFWGMQGAKDGLTAFALANPTNTSVAEIQRHNPYDIKISGNVSLTYHINKDSGVIVFVENIPIIGDNKRYSYSSGFKNSYPDKVSWIEEPTVVGFKWYFRF
jgi:outer membrane receptor protein involved in Fe transport